MAFFFCFMPYELKLSASRKKLPIPVQHVSRLVYLSGGWRKLDDGLDCFMGGDLQVDKEGL